MGFLEQIMCNMNRPNLFSYATSELSQDAFICWLLAWASPEHEKTDPYLHQCGVGFVRALFSKHSKDAPSQIEKIEVDKQDNNIDVLCIINGMYPILIEDKTGSKNHSNQLVRYLENVKNRNYKEENIIPIYFKTEDQCDYSDVLAKGYRVFSRSDFLDVLNSDAGLKVSNQIFTDYRDYLQSISDHVDRYKTLSMSEWAWYQWVGFYIALREKADTLKDGKWDYVPNKSGGFLGFWWYWDDNTGTYLQLEEGKLCFKIEVGDVDKRAEKKWEWHNKIMEAAKRSPLHVKKPSRLRNGHWMTVAVVDDDYRSANKDGTLNMAETIEIIQQAEECIALARFMKV